MTPILHTFAGNPLDRSSNERRDRAWIEATLQHPDARYLVFRDLNPLIRGQASPQLAWRSRAQLATFHAPAAVLLGVRDGTPHLAADVTGVDAATLDTLAGDDAFTGAREAGAALPLAEAGILAQARSLIDWHARSRYCPACGGGTAPRVSGDMRRCGTCGADHFPRVNPVVIVLVTHGERCLLARPSARMLPMYTCVAGFIEPGETIEEAVRREVHEETGVEVGAVRYHSSQPWPFPSSLMIGCHADATSTDIEVDRDEIGDAQWFTRDEVAQALAATDAGVEPSGGAGFGVPPPFTIAHQLIRAWVEAAAE